MHIMLCSFLDLKQYASYGSITLSVLLIKVFGVCTSLSTSRILTQDLTVHHSLR